MSMRPFHSIPQVLALLQMLSLPALAAPSYEVEFRGSQRDVVHGIDLSDHVAVAPIVARPHLYAVGPLSGLKGEISIIDSEAWIATVTAQTTDAPHPRVEVNSKVGAPFLVWAEVPRWDTIPLTQEVIGLKGLQEVVERVAKESGIDTSRPFPFRLKATMTARYHVLNRTDQGPHGPQEHERIKVKFDMERESAELVGFWSDQHQGVFTSQNSHIHVHILSEDHKKSGHLDDVTIDSSAVLFLPSRD